LRKQGKTKPASEKIDMQMIPPAPVRIRKKHKQSLPGKIFIIAVLAVLLLLIGSGVFKSVVTRFLISVVPVETTQLEDTVTADFLIIRQETALSAPFKGFFEEAVHDGERVAKNTVIGHLMKNAGSSLEKTEKVALLSPQAGILSYFVDGYEGVLTPQTWPQLDLAKLPELKKELDKKTTGTEGGGRSVEAGEYYCKIVDNLAPCSLFAEGVQGLPEGLAAGSAVNLRLDGLNEQLIDARITDFMKAEEGDRVLFSIPYVTGIEDIRSSAGKIVTGKYGGMVVDRKVLVTKDETAGIYLLSKGHVLWVPIQVTAVIDNKAVLRGLANGDWIIATPGLVKEGQRVFSLH